MEIFSGKRKKELFRGERENGWINTRNKTI